MKERNKQPLSFTGERITKEVVTRIDMGPTLMKISNAPRYITATTSMSITIESPCNLSTIRDTDYILRMLLGRNVV